MGSGFLVEILAGPGKEQRRQFGVRMWNVVAATKLAFGTRAEYVEWSIKEECFRSNLDTIWPESVCESQNGSKKSSSMRECEVTYGGGGSAVKRGGRVRVPLTKPLLPHRYDRSPQGWSPTISIKVLLFDSFQNQPQPLTRLCAS
jgi:hypothetical protein